MTFALWRVIIAACGLCAAALITLPGEGLRIASFVAAMALAVLAIVVRPDTDGARDDRAWALIAGSVAGLTIADGLRAIAGGTGRFWAVPIHSLAIAAMTIAVIFVLQTASADRKRDHIDALIAAVGLGLVSWIFILDPIATDDAIGFVDRMVALTPPILDLVLLTLITRLAFVASGGSVPARLLIGGVGAIICADAIASIGYVETGLGEEVIVRLLTVSGAVLLALCSAHPNVNAVIGVYANARQTNRARMLFLGVAAIGAPIALIVRTLLDSTVNVPVVVSGMAVLFVLILVRMSGLVQGQAEAVEKHRESTTREKILRRAGHALVAATDREAMFAIAIDAAEALVRDRPNWTVRLFAGAGPRMGLVAARGERPDSDATWLAMTKLPSETSHSLGMGEPSIVRFLGDRREDVEDALGITVERPVAFLVPLVVDDAVAGVLAVSLDRPPGESRRRALETVGSQAALAIETAALTEDLVTRASEERFRSLIQNASDVISVVDRSGIIGFITPSVTALLGYSPDVLTGRNLAALLHPEDASGGPGVMVDGASIDWRLRGRDGGYRRVEVVVADLSDDPNVGGIVLTMRDVTERRELESRLAHQAFHDPLTGLANRALFEDRVAQALARFARRPTSTVAVAFIDLDDFKAVNDTLGHQAGDQLLVEVSHRIRACLRPTDTAARLGGDEFAIALEIDDFAADEAIGIVVDRLLAALQRPLTVAGREVFTRGSIGIAATPEAGTTVAEILRNADIAMYTAKRNGKGAMHRFTPDSDAPLRRELSLTGDLLRAVEHGEFHLEYQPIIDLASSRVRGLEALVRWDHPTHGRVRPDEFIRLAEESGAISDVGRWILSEACREFQTWRKASPEIAHWFVTVNISGHQLHRGDLVGDVRAAIRATGIAPGNLVLELTESVLMDNTEGAIAVLSAIRALGVRVAIDDFGTGFSSLAYLKRLPIDVLKLAAPFVHGLADDDEPLTEAIIHLSRTLGLDVIAEGIERRVEADALRAMGCAMGQGYLFSRPMPAGQVQAAVHNLAARRGQAATVPSA